MDETEESATCNALCNDVLAKILLLPSLPVKSLLQFKSVCKQWRDLISDPTFVKLHLDISNCNQNFSQIHMSGYNKRSYPDKVKSLDGEKCQPLGEPERPWSGSLSPLTSECLENDVVQLGEPVKGIPLSLLDVYGSCNGLLLIATTDKSFLWNPTISEHTELQGKSYIWDIDLSEESRLTGLGYNSVLDEYKAVVVVVDRDNSYLAKVRCKMTRIYIYNSRIGYWKKVHLDFPYGISKCCALKGVTVNGFPHWAYVDKIMFFDTVNDAFDVLPTPIEWCENGNFIFLCTWGTCLCVWQRNVMDETYDVWIMKEYGVVESWTKLLVIPFFKRFYFWPLGLTNNEDEVLAQVDKKIVTYIVNTKEGNFEIGTTNPISSGGLRSFGYVLSLVSPCNLRKGGGKRRMESNMLHLGFLMMLAGSLSGAWIRFVVKT